VASFDKPFISTFSQQLNSIGYVKLDYGERIVKCAKSRLRIVPSLFNSTQVKKHTNHGRESNGNLFVPRPCLTSQHYADCDALIKQGEYKWIRVVVGNKSICKCVYCDIELQCHKHFKPTREK
jgi:hypothetical protein